MSNGTVSPTRRKISMKDQSDDMKLSSPSKTKHSNIPRTYSGMYGQGGNTGGDLLPFELARNRNTDWCYQSKSFLLVGYILLILAAEMIIMTITPTDISWTITNALHGFITLLYFHWIKGSPNFYEQGGEMNGMTFWEQIESSPNNIHQFHFFIKTSIIVPTVLCHLACHFGKYKPLVVLINLCVWLCLVIIPKMSFMNGVRILGINRTAGIDDYDFWWKTSQ